MTQWFPNISAGLKRRLGVRALGSIVPFAGVALAALLLATNVRADTSTTYYACVNMHSGTIRMTTADGTCLSTETKINWNQVGPAGPAGPTGPTGPMGPAGPAGANQQLTVTSVVGDTITVNPGQSGIAFARCPSNSIALPGGEELIQYHNDPTDPVAVGDVVKGVGQFDGAAHGWLESIQNINSTRSVDFAVFVYCFSLASAPTS
jgi:hypothetical protein